MKQLFCILPLVFTLVGCTTTPPAATDGESSGRTSASEQASAEERKTNCTDIKGLMTVTKEYPDGRREPAAEVGKSVCVSFMELLNSLTPSKE